MYHRSGQTTASIAGEVYKTNVDITSHSLLNKIMQYTEVAMNRYTRFGTNTEPLAPEYYKNTQKLNHKNLTVKQSGFLIKQTHPHVGASSNDIVSCICHHNERVPEITCSYNTQNELNPFSTNVPLM